MAFFLLAAKHVVTFLPFHPLIWLGEVRILVRDLHEHAPFALVETCTPQSALTRVYRRLEMAWDMRVGSYGDDGGDSVVQRLQSGNPKFNAPQALSDFSYAELQTNG